MNAQNFTLPICWSRIDAQKALNCAPSACAPSPTAVGSASSMGSLPVPTGSPRGRRAAVVSRRSSRSALEDLDRVEHGLLAVAAAAHDDAAVVERDGAVVLAGGGQVDGAGDHVAEHAVDLARLERVLAVVAGRDELV